MRIPKNKKLGNYRNFMWPASHHACKNVNIGGLKRFMMPSGEYDDDEGDDDDDDVFMHIMSFRWLAKKHVFIVNYIYPFFLREA